MSYTCKSGHHAWLDPVSAERCCNEWHQELRIPSPNPEDDPQGRVHTDVGTFVWVKNITPTTQ